MNIAKAMSWQIDHVGKTLVDINDTLYRFLDGVFEYKLPDNVWYTLNLDSDELLVLNFEPQITSRTCLNDLMNKNEGYFKGDSVYKKEGNWYFFADDIALKNEVSDEDFFDLYNWNFRGDKNDCT